MNETTIIHCRECDFFKKPKDYDETTNYIGKCTQPQTHISRQLRHANHFCGYAKKSEGEK